MKDKIACFFALRGIRNLHPTQDFLNSKAKSLTYYKCCCNLTAIHVPNYQVKIYWRKTSFEKVEKK